MDFVVDLVVTVAAMGIELVRRSCKERVMMRTRTDVAEQGSNCTRQCDGGERSGRYMCVVRSC